MRLEDVYLGAIRVAIKVRTDQTRGNTAQMRDGPCGPQDRKAKVPNKVNITWLPGRLLLFLHRLVIPYAKEVAFFYFVCRKN